MIITIAEILCFVIILTAFHELGHIIFAKILGLDIQKVGFSLRPYPHVFVSIKWPYKKTEKLIYLFSGSFITLSLFFISFVNDFFEHKFLYYAFAIQFIIETNPFYSDFTIAVVSNNIERLKNNRNINADFYKNQFLKYQFSFKWYIHFVLWTLLITLLFNLKKQII
ncbi:MAG: hypothetical protein FVQ77_05980 [Cytophagales bacterium]|nr:hypothetical protein [Cytophagales bacterium]